MSKRRYVGNYAREIKVGDTYAMTAPGDFLEPDEEDAEVKEMVENGTLIEGEPPKEDAASSMGQTNELKAKVGGDK